MKTWVMMMMMVMMMKLVSDEKRDERRSPHEDRVQERARMDVSGKV